MTARLSLMRHLVIVGAILCLLMTGYSVLRYPAILLPLRIGIIYAGVLVLVLLSNVVIVLCLTSSTDSDSAWIANRGLTWGIWITGFWLIEIVTGNLFNPNYSIIRLVYFSSSMIAFTAPLLAGALATKQSASVRAGTLVGLWSGVVSGPLTFLILMTVTYLFLNTLLRDPENLLQFHGSGAPDLITFIIGDSLAGATGHLVIGLILGPGLGAVGAIIGQLVTPRISTSINP